MTEFTGRSFLVSEPTQFLFYSLKVISKKHWTSDRETEEIAFAKALVKENAIIYLDLMQELIDAVESRRTFDDAVDKAKTKVECLVARVDESLRRSYWSAGFTTRDRAATEEPIGGDKMKLFAYLDLAKRKTNSCTS